MASGDVDLLKTVGLAVRLNGGPISTDSQPIRLDFVFGIASWGLTPFEYELSGKPVGHEIVVPIDRTRFSAFFGHLAPVLAHRFPDLMKGGFDTIAFRVESIAETSQREIIRAMAAATEGCSGGDCGCGCH